MDLQQHLSFTVVSSKEHLEEKLVDGLMTEVLAIVETKCRAEHTEMTE